MGQIGNAKAVGACLTHPIFKWKRRGEACKNRYIKVKVSENEAIHLIDHIFGKYANTLNVSDLKRLRPSLQALSFSPQILPKCAKIVL